MNKAVVSRARKRSLGPDVRAPRLYARGADGAPQLSKALALFEPDGKPAQAGQEGKALHDPEDLRVLARNTQLWKRPPFIVSERLRSWKHWRTRILPVSEDRFLLAHLYDATGDWPKARSKYRELDVEDPKSQGHGNPQPSTRLSCSVRKQFASTSQAQRHRRPEQRSRTRRRHQATSAQLR